jgi:hypothetical protein
VIPSVEGPAKVTSRDIDNMVTRAAELAALPGHYATDQFNNPYMIPDHRDKLGGEIWEQTGFRFSFHSYPSPLLTFTHLARCLLRVKRSTRAVRPASRLATPSTPFRSKRAITEMGG